MRPIGCFETSIRNYHSTLPKLPKACSSHLHRDRNLKSRRSSNIFDVLTSQGNRRQGKKQVKFGCTQDSVGLSRTNKISGFFRVTESNHTVNQSINQSLKQSSISKQRPLHLFCLQGNPSAHLGLWLVAFRHAVSVYFRAVQTAAADSPPS